MALTAQVPLPAQLTVSPSRPHLLLSKSSMPMGQDILPVSSLVSNGSQPTLNPLESPPSPFSLCLLAVPSPRLSTAL